MTSIYAEAEVAVDVLLFELPLPINIHPLNSMSPQQSTVTYFPLSITGKGIILHVDAKTSASRTKMPSKVFRSPYLIAYGSSNKEK